MILKLIAASAAASIAFAPAPTRPAPELLSCEKLPDVPRKSLATLTVEFGPGAKSPPHHHPGSLTAYVLEGAVHSEVKGGASGTYRAGQTWFESAGVVHLVAENASTTEPAKLLVVMIAGDGCRGLSVPERP
jgi:quercetin dioxygenase-like cupin family protein